MDFFDRLFQFYQKQPEFPLLNHYIQSQFETTLSFSREVIYETYLDYLLDFLDIPRKPDSARKELKALYRLSDKIDPFYFTKEQIDIELEKCPSLSLAIRPPLNERLRFFFELVKKHEGYSQLLQYGISHPESWYSLAPKHCRWKVLELLHSFGHAVISSKSGYRAWYRWQLEKIPEDVDSPEDWQKLCKDWGEQNGKSSNYADLLGQAFVGELTHIGVPGFCQTLPNCRDCPLREPCQWNKGTTSMLETPLIERMMIKEQLDSISADALLNYLWEMDEGERETIQAILGDSADLKNLGRKSLIDLGQMLPGNLGLPKKLKVFLELCKRYNVKSLKPGNPFQSSSEIFKHFRFKLRDQKQELFILVLLDNRHHYMDETMISKGTLNRSLVHPREVFAAAIQQHAAAIICVHNHPSGNPIASQEDIEVTRRLSEVGKVVGIPVLDHIVIGNDQFFSLSDHNLL